MKLSLKGFEKANQYFLSDELPNNKLLISSFIVGRKSVPGNIFHRYISEEFSNSKIIFTDINNFEEIKSSKLFKRDIKYIIFENNIVVHNGEYILIYDINSLEVIKTIELIKIDHYMYKYDNKYLITISEEEDNN